MKRFLKLAILCALATSPASAQFSGAGGKVELYRLPEGVDKIAAIAPDRNLVQSTPDSTSLQPLGAALENLDYPVATRFLELEIQGQRVRMAYMDAASGMLGGMTPFVAGQRPLPTVLLLHGKNFSGFYFENVMRALTSAGYRVIVPDQIGFGKSSKPDIAYSFDLLADNTAKLLDELKIARVSVLGHSMGGMLAAKFALKYPERVSKLILENPIGLEDYGQFIPAQTLETVYQNELADTDAAKIRAFYARYFVRWKPEYEKLADIKARQALGGEWPRVAKSAALTYQMIVSQPVINQFSQIQAPTLLIIGQEDRTVVGKNYASAEATKGRGNYSELGKSAARAIRGAKLAEFAGVGHIPHLEAPEKFNSTLLEFLK